MVLQSTAFVDTFALPSRLQIAGTFVPVKLGSAAGLWFGCLPRRQHPAQVHTMPEPTCMLALRGAGSTLAIQLAARLAVRRRLGRTHNEIVNSRSNLAKNPAVHSQSVHW